LDVLKDGYGLAIKRAIDLSLSGVGLILVIPVVAIAGLLVYLEDRGPPLFRQTRTGRAGQPFEMIKLRSMRVNTIPVHELGRVGEDHPLITRIGRVLRRFRIDELPQLLNVLRGDMSLVGPRPAMPEQTARYGASQRRRLRMRPGLTGWAQVNGSTSFRSHERILLDVWYVDHWSLALDARILMRTIGVVLWGERRNLTALAQATAYVGQPVTEPVDATQNSESDRD
jgi:lipopolysaccharide/colanic/teichoic acid biosynthesis glycosyltransferase